MYGVNTDCCYNKVGKFLEAENMRDQTRHCQRFGSFHVLFLLHKIDRLKVFRWIFVAILSTMKDRHTP